MCEGCDQDKPIHARRMCVACYAKRQRWGLVKRKPRAERAPCSACGAPYQPRNFARGLCGTCRKRVWRNAPRKRKYASQYVGVTVYRDRWYVSKWMMNGKQVSGHLRPRSEQGERWAAQDRARGLGREFLERRDGKKIVYKWRAYEEMDNAA